MANTPNSQICQKKRYKTTSMTILANIPKSKEKLRLLVILFGNKNNHRGQKWKIKQHLKS